MRKTNAQGDNVRLAYAFWVNPIDKLPDSFWKQAERMRDLQNILVEKNKEFEIKAAEVKDEGGKEAVTAVWREFNDWFYNLS